jgi:hypothetical protein
MQPPSRYVTRALAVVALAVLPWMLHGFEVPATASRFSEQVESLSEEPGAFDTDNLISNERSYLDVVPALISGNVVGGAYIGVGPDQNFSYITRVRPAMAFIIDIRRDNLLLHLLFKALFSRATTRAEYVSLLTGRSPPEPRDRWADAPLSDILEYIERADADDRNSSPLRRKLDETIASFGIPLSREDFATIARFHRAFIDSGTQLQFNSHGRPPRPSYPTFRELLLATDRAGRVGSYLAMESDYQFIRAMQKRDAIVPVTGNLSGEHALLAIGRLLRERGEQVSAIYVSNVEDYLFREGAFARYSRNLGQLPRNARSVIIRSVFGADGSSSLVQNLDLMMTGVTEGRYRTYWDVVQDR